MLYWNGAHIFLPFTLKLPCDPRLSPVPSCYPLTLLTPSFLPPEKKRAVGMNVTEVGTGAMKITCMCSVSSPALKCSYKKIFWSQIWLYLLFYSVWVPYWCQQDRRNGSETNLMCGQKFLLEKWALSTRKSITALRLRTSGTQTTQTFRL